MVKFETKLNADSTKQLNKHAFARLGWIMLIFSILLIAIGLVGYFLGTDSEDRVLGIALAVFGVLFAPFIWVLSSIAQKNFNKSAKYITDETDEIYIFDNDTLYIKQVSKNMQSETTYNYDYLYKVIESATYYFLYISKRQCHIVPKNSITEGDINTLNECLQQKLGKKFSTKRF